MTEQNPDIVAPVDWSAANRGSPNISEIEAAWQYFTRTIARSEHQHHADYIAIVMEDTWVADHSSINWCEIRLRFRGRETVVRENGRTKKLAILFARKEALNKCRVDFSKVPIPQHLNSYERQSILNNRRRREELRTEQPDSSAPDSTSGSRTLLTPSLHQPSTSRIPPIRRIPPSATISVPPPEPQPGPSSSTLTSQPQSFAPIGPLSRRVSATKTSSSTQTSTMTTVDATTHTSNSLHAGTSVLSQGLNGNIARRYLNFLIHSCFRGGETLYAFNSNRTGIRVIIRLRDGREFGEDLEYVPIQGNEEMARELAARNALVRRFGICFVPDRILQLLDEQRKRKNASKRTKMNRKRCGDEDKGGRPPKSHKP